MFSLILKRKTENLKKVAMMYLNVAILKYELNIHIESENLYNHIYDPYMAMNCVKTSINHPD